MTEVDEARWIKEEMFLVAGATESFIDSSRTEIWHLDGVPWHKAPLPPRIHRCTAQTKGWVNYFTLVQRCACGAIRRDNDVFWHEKNQSRKGSTRREVPENTPRKRWWRR